MRLGPYDLNRLAPGSAIKIDFTRKRSDSDGSYTWLATCKQRKSVRKAHLNWYLYSGRARPPSIYMTSMDQRSVPQSLKFRSFFFPVTFVRLFTFIALSTESSSHEYRRRSASTWSRKFGERVKISGHALYISVDGAEELGKLHPQPAFSTRLISIYCHCRKSVPR